jgi:hypothetical protein
MIDQQFTQLLQNHADTLADRRRFAGILKDLIPGMALQTNLLLNLFDIDIHGELEKAVQIDNPFIYRFAKRLCDEYGVSKENADWAVAAWCNCYGGNILNKLCDISISETEATVSNTAKTIMPSRDANYQDYISAGKGSTYGLKADGTVEVVGSNSYGQRIVCDWRNIIAVSAGAEHIVGSKSDGTVLAVGKNDEYQCDVADWNDIVAVSAGWNHTIGLQSDGTVEVVGSNSYGQLNVADWCDIVAVSAGGSHTVGLKSDGTVVAVGLNNNGQCNVAGWCDIVAVSATDGYDYGLTVGLKSDGTVVAVGENFYGQRKVRQWRNIGLVTK